MKYTRQVILPLCMATAAMVVINCGGNAPIATLPAVTRAPADSGNSGDTGNTGNTGDTGNNGNPAPPQGNQEPPVAPGPMGDAKEAAARAASGEQAQGAVTLLGPWKGSDQDTFMAVVQPFQDATGVQVQYESSDSLKSTLADRVQTGNAPDLAVLPSVREMGSYGNDNKLVDLTDILDREAMGSQYSQSWNDVASFQHRPVSVIARATVKSLIWYNPKQYKGPTPPTNWDELQSWSQQTAGGSTPPWCMGLGNGAPGTDWIEDFVLHQAGPDKYDDWAQGRLPWSSPEVKAAFEAFGKLATDPKMVAGGPSAAAITDEDKAADNLFQSTPGCYLLHGSSRMPEIFAKSSASPKSGDDFNAFPFPDIESQNAGSLVVSADLVGLFKDTPQGRALLKYLATPEAQAIWVQHGAGLSPNKVVPADAYSDPAFKPIGQALPNATIVRYDASEQMPDAMADAFNKAVLDYVQHPDTLDSILTNLDTVQQDAYK